MAFKKRRVWTSQPQEVVELDWGNPDTVALAGAWPLQDGQFRDATGLYNGTLNAGVTPSVSQLGRTLTFNGSSGVVSLAAVASGGLDLSNKNHSVSLWLYPTNLTGFRVIFHQYNGSIGPILFTNGTSLIWQVGNSSNRITATSGVDLDKWQHFVVTYAPSSLVIYKNGALLQSGTPTTENTSTATVQLGGNSSLGWYTTGQMAAPAVWTRTLSADEARRQYEATWELYAPRTIWVPVSAGGGGATDLTVADLANAHTLDNVVLTSSTALVVQDMAHGHALDAPTLSTGTALTVADAQHAHTLDNVTLSTTGTVSLTVANSLHGHALDAVVLTSQTDLAAADMAHGHALDGVTLTLGGVSLVIAEIMHAHALDAVALTLDTYLAVADLLHAHTIDNVLVSIPGGTLDLILKILVNRQELNPATGTFTLYDDDGTTVLYTTNAWADAAGTVPYSGGALRRIDALF